MLETIIAQLHIALSMGMGRRLSTRMMGVVIDGLRQTRREFGAIGQEGAEMVGGPTLDADTRREMQSRRLRQMAQIAGRETTYYRELFGRLNLNFDRITADDPTAIPITTKTAVQQQGDAFISQKAKPYLQASTTGTTGRPTTIPFSLHEMQIYAGLQAIEALVSGSIDTADIVQISTASRGLLGNATLAGSCAHVGAMVTTTGIVEPAYALARLAEKRAVPGKRDKVSILYTYPSYLGEMIEEGQRLGYGPADFGLRQIALGGEIVTPGLIERSKAVFGELPVVQGYGMTEIWPLGGTLCEAGHLHFQPNQGLIEVLKLDGSGPAGPGEAGVIVATPFRPYRETTLLLRYETGDVVRPLETEPTCSLAAVPATSGLLGKQKHAVQHDGGWSFSQEVLSAVERVTAVPLPARCRWEAVGGGIGVHVLVRSGENRPSVRQELGEALEANGVPVQAIYLYEDRNELGAVFPWRSDQREMTLSESKDFNAAVQSTIATQRGKEVEKREGVGG